MVGRKKEGKVGKVMKSGVKRGWDIARWVMESLYYRKNGLEVLLLTLLLIDIHPDRFVINYGSGIRDGYIQCFHHPRLFYTDKFPSAQSRASFLQQVIYVNIAFTDIHVQEKCFPLGNHSIIARIDRLHPSGRTRTYSNAK